MFSRKALFSVGICVARLVCPNASTAATLTLHPIADTAIYSAFPTFNFGGGSSITAGGRPQGGESRGLLLFDIGGNLPAGALIQSASLQMTVVDTPPSGAVNSIFDLNPMTASWAEGTGSDRGGSAAGPNAATWNNRSGTTGSPWTTSGGDFSSSISAFVSILGNGVYTFSSPALATDIQGWLSNPATDFGWILRSESELTSRTIRRFGSHEDAFNSPVLTIQYVAGAVPKPSTWSLICLGLATMVWKRRKGTSTRPL